MMKTRVLCYSFFSFRTMMLVCISLLALCFARSNAFSSFLTDEKNKTSTTLENKDHAWNDVDFLRQMINQETVIRLALVKNVQTLAGDVTQMKKSITTSELTISAPWSLWTVVWTRSNRKINYWKILALFCRIEYWILKQDWTIWIII